MTRPLHVHIDEVVVSGLTEDQRHSVAARLPAQLEQLVSTLDADRIGLGGAGGLDGPGDAESRRIDHIDSMVQPGVDPARAVAGSLLHALTDQLGGDS